MRRRPRVHILTSTSRFIGAGLLGERPAAERIPAQIDAKRGQRSFALRINPRKLGFGVHRVRARVVFAAESRTAARTLRLSFQRCTRQAGTPQFTG